MDTSQPQTGTSKQIAWIVLIVVVLALAVGGYFMLTQKDGSTNNANSTVNTNANIAIEVDTSGWNTYENTKYGYSVKYPSTWELVDPFPSPQGPSVYEEITLAGNGLSITVDIPAQKGCDTDVLQCINSFRDLHDEFIDTSTGLTITSIDNITAYTETRDAIYYDATAPNSQQHNKRIYYYLMREKIIVSIEFEFPAGDNNAPQVVQEILRYFQIDWD